MLSAKEKAAYAAIRADAFASEMYRLGVGFYDMEELEVVTSEYLRLYREAEAYAKLAKQECYTLFTPLLGWPHLPAMESQCDQN